jgi:hypothetical protein
MRFLYLKIKFSICLHSIPHFLQGLILSNTLRAQKSAEDEGYTIALNNLHFEAIELRNEGLEKDKILNSLLKKQKKTKMLPRPKLKLRNAKSKIFGNSYSKLKKNVALQRLIEILVYIGGTTYKKQLMKKSIECVKKIKTSFANVSTFSNEDNFVRGDPEGPIDWVSNEAEAFEEVLSGRGDIYAFSGARGITAILEKSGCDHVKALAQSEATLSIEDTKDPSAEASLIGGKFFTDIWENGGRGMAHEMIKKSEKDSHDSKEATKAAEKAAELERRIGIA